jgi:nucleotide-binding universal stress UspA family protein
LEAIAAPLRTDRVQIGVKATRGLAGEEILREAEACDAHLIAIGTQGRGGLDRFFLGSVAEWVLHRAQCPVLTVRKSE